MVNSPIQSYIVLLIGSGHAQQAPQITFTTHATHSIVVNSPIQSYIVLLIGSGHAQQAPQITFTTDISETPIIVLLLSGLHFREQLMTTGYRSRGYYGLLSLLHTLSQQQPHSADFHIYTQYHITFTIHDHSYNCGRVHPIQLHTSINGASQRTIFRVGGPLDTAQFLL